jgi:hypothetical protein
MTVQDLIDRLSKQDPSMHVMLLDGPNGSGTPRDLNLGPVTRSIEETDADESADCEGRVGEEVLVLGFGCY